MKPLMQTLPSCVRVPVAAHRRFLALVLPAIAVLLGTLAPAASAAGAPAPALKLTQQALPTNFEPGLSADAANSNVADPAYGVVITNLGGAPTAGSVTVVDTLPAGVTPAAASPPGIRTTFDGSYDTAACSAAGQVVTCTETNPVGPDEFIYVAIPVDVSASAPPSITNDVTVSGGGAATVSSSISNPVGTSPAQFGFLPDAQGMSFNAVAEDGTAATQAGSHPFDVNIEAGFPSQHFDGGTVGNDLWGAGTVRDLTFTLPNGLVVNPQATPTRCTEAQLASTDAGGGCYAETQVGDIVVLGILVGTQPLVFPLYNMVPPPGEPAEFGFDILGTQVHIAGGLSGSFDLTASSHDIIAKLASLNVQAVLWADPSDDRHAPSRTAPTCPSGGCLVNHSNTPFITMPSACSGPLSMTATADSWEDTGNFQSDSTQTHDVNGNPVGITGCSSLAFNPSITVQPDSHAADSPTGLDVDLQVPQNQGVNGLATANLRKAVVQLPAGMSVDPSAADGLGACSPAQIGVGSDAPPSCPDTSKIGSVQLTTPLLDAPLQGSVYLAAQGANPFGTLLAVYIVAEGQGVVIKLPGRVDADPATGQLTATFDNNPELPFSDLKVHFDGGSRGVLTTPSQCGTYAIHSGLSPWSGTPAVGSDSSFTIDQGCATGGFAPGLNAGLSNPAAGSSSSFNLQLTRQDGEQNIAGLTTVLPPGLLAKLAGVPLCPDLLAATGDCPAGSQVGSTTVGAGSGPTPVFIPQAGKSPTAVYLAGAYKGAPYSLVIKVPAQAGPFDLGVVTVRAGIYVDPTTAQVTVRSDALPQIIQGIPLEYRDIRVMIDRPGFIQAPTSCDPMVIAADVTGVPLGGPVSVNAAGVGYSTATGTVAHVADRFQVGDCRALAFAPKLRMQLTGKGKTRSGDHPNLISTLTQPFGGQANIADVKVALPLSIALDPNDSNHVCDYDTALAVHGGAVPCPASTIVGSATAVTPLLDHPLTGKVYLVQGIRFSHGNRIRTLPTLLIPLRGQIALDLRAATSVNGAQQLVTTFSTIPDAAVSTFTLNITGGKKGLLVITGRGRSICNTRQVTNATLDAQSGKTNTQNDTITTPCGKPAHIRVFSHRVKGHTLLLRVGTSERGRLTISGHGLRPFSRVLKRGAHTVRVALTRRATRARRVTVTVTLTPANAMPAKHTLRLRT